MFDGKRTACRPNVSRCISRCCRNNVKLVRKPLLDVVTEVTKFSASKYTRETEELGSLKDSIARQMTELRWQSLKSSLIQQVQFELDQVI